MKTTLSLVIDKCLQLHGHIYLSFTCREPDILRLHLKINISYVFNVIATKIKAAYIEKHTIFRHNLKKQNESHKKSYFYKTKTK